jgi:hypothetical protein
MERRSSHQVFSASVVFINMISYPLTLYISAKARAVCGEPAEKNECWKFTVIPTFIYGCSGFLVEYSR